MSGITLQADVQGLDALQATLDRLRQAGRDRRVWVAVAEIIVASTQRRFREQRDPEGNPWPKSKVARWGDDGKLILSDKPGQTMTDTARLRRSITRQVSPGRVEVGSNVAYAAIHNEGGVIKPKSARALRFGGRMVRQVTMPRRRFLGISPGDQTEIVATVVEEMGHALQGA